MSDAFVEQVARRLEGDVQGNNAWLTGETAALLDTLLYKDRKSLRDVYLILKNAIRVIERCKPIFGREQP